MGLPKFSTGYKIPKFRIIGTGAVNEYKPERTAKGQDLKGFLDKRDRRLAYYKNTGKSRILGLMTLYTRQSRNLAHEPLPTISADTEEMLANPRSTASIVVRSNTTKETFRYGWTGWKKFL